eukprot:765762-Hanusia_phi.AAC.4
MLNGSLGSESQVRSPSLLLCEDDSRPADDLSSQQRRDQDLGPANDELDQDVSGETAAHRAAKVPDPEAQAHKERITAMALHPYAPVLAAGSDAQMVGCPHVGYVLIDLQVNVISTGGEVLNTIKYHEGFLGQRIGPICSVAFHPLRLILAAGATDSIISIYSGS